MKQYKLKFSYKAFRAEFPIFDYQQQDYITIDQCNKLYGKEVTKKAVENPWKVIEPEAVKEIGQMVIN